jgi:PKD repeat protein
MKKLFTLIVASLLSIVSVNAQNCDFTVTQNPSGSYTFTAPSGLANSGLSFNWSLNNSSVYQSGYSVDYTYPTNMTDVVSLYVFAGGPDTSLICTSTQTITVTGSNQGGGCTISASLNDSLPNTYNFSIPGANYPATWTFSDGTTASGFNVTHTFTNLGMNTVCGNIMGGGFSCSDCIDVFVMGDSTNVNTGCNASFYASTSALVGYYIPTGNYYSNATMYSWSFGDGSSSTSMYPYHEYTTSGSYNVCLIVNDGECSDSSCQYVYIPTNNTFPNDSLCYAGFIITQNNPFEVTIVNTSSDMNSTYTWTLSSSLLTITATGAFPSILVENTGNYLLCITSTNAMGCTSTFCDTIVVDASGMIGGRLNSAGFTINVVSPQTITGYDITGIDNLENAAISVYPNPFNDVITLAGVSSNSTIQIFSVDGKNVYQGNATSSTLNTSNLSAGVYMLSITDVQGNRQVQKIVKQ